MHQPIRNGLEAYLTGDTGLPEDFSEHLKSCSECSEQVEVMRQQSQMLGSLHADAEPRPGFYARVLERIDRQVRPSIWALMLEPAFGRSIAVACAVITLVLGTYLIATQPGDMVARPVSVIQTQDLAQQDAVATQQDRDAVLINLASFREN